MRSKFTEIFRALSYVTQIGLSAAVPLIIWIWLAGLVKNRFSLGNYVTVIGIILGVASAYVNLFKLFKRISIHNKNEKERKNDQ